jgi:beta-alanine--pyruvate transaminase
VVDVRTIGLMGGVELNPGTDRKYGQEMSRAWEAFDRLFFEENIVMRYTGNVLAMSPPLIVEEKHIEKIVSGIRRALEKVK